MRRRSRRLFWRVEAGRVRVLRRERQPSEAVAAPCLRLPRSRSIFTRTSRRRMPAGERAPFRQRFGLAAGRARAGGAAGRGSLVSKDRYAGGGARCRRSACGGRPYRIASASATQDKHEPGDGCGERVALFVAAPRPRCRAPLGRGLRCSPERRRGPREGRRSCRLLGERLEGADKPAVGGDAEPERG